jgi:poly(3-hydroxybutyrate) depolymerase
VRGLWIVGLMLAACGDGDLTTDTLDTEVEPVFDPVVELGVRALAERSDGDCPSMRTSGEKTFSSAGVEREIQVYLPEDVAPGTPALMVWHGLGDSGSSMGSWMQLQLFADTYGVVVVAPESLDSSGDTWRFSPGGSDDLTMFDDLRTCLYDKLEIDLARLYTTGFSFGGLWTTYLTMHRSDAFAASVIMSGGTIPFYLPYETPEHTLPVMVMWGGTGDTYGSGPTEVRFEDTSMALSASLQSDGHVVAHCVHSGGHTVPNEIHDILSEWIGVHSYGDTSPYTSALEGPYPSWCSLQ